MHFWEKVRCWFNKNKKYVVISGTVGLIIVGAGVSYVLFKNKKVSFPDWLKFASKEELEEAYEILRFDFCQTDTKSYGMEQIGQELGARGAKEWFEKHSPNLDPAFRWTDVNRWEKN